MTTKYTIGLDFGTDSVRCLIADTANGRKVSGSVYNYPRWSEGQYCNSGDNMFRQHPLDYLEGLQNSVVDALDNAPAGTAGKIAGVTAGTTGSTPVAVNINGTPLSLTRGFENNPNAMFILWKDHTAIKESGEITRLAKNWHIDYTRFEGGRYSSEWFWAKILHVIRNDAAVLRAAYSWVELCDWIPAVLTGNRNPKTLIRNRCAAGHKAMWHRSFNGLPPEEFLTTLDPLLAGLRERLYKETYTCDTKAGTLSPEWAEKLGLPENTTVGIGALDAHMGAVGTGIKPYYLSKVMGTSTCDMLVVPPLEMGEKVIKGICGQTDGSIVPGLIGLEAGQAAFGDIYNWFRQLLEWPLKHILSESQLIGEKTKKMLMTGISDQILKRLCTEADKIPLEESGIIALEWMNGRRSPDANEALKGAITGLTLGSDAPRIFRALVEATAFGSKAINDRFIKEGLRIDGIIALGGVAKKSPFVMQIVADVLNMPIMVARSEQACALGSAMAASVASGICNSIPDAQQRMSSGIDTEYRPIPENTNNYKKLYKKYLKLGRFIEYDH